MKNGKGNAKQLLLNKINNYCNIAIGSVSGVFAGNAFAVIKGFMKNPDAYIAGNSAPWYTPLITSGIGTAVIIAAIAIGKKVATSKLGIDLGGTSNEKLTVTKSTLVSGGAANQQVPGHSGSGRKLADGESAGTRAFPEGSRNPAADNHRGAVSKKRQKRAKGKK